MNLTDLKLFFRNLRRDRTIASINAIGLIFGLLSALLIFKYVLYERSFDSHHENADQIYRVAYNRYHNEEIMWETANCYFPAGDWLKDNYAEVVNQARLTHYNRLTITIGTETGTPVTFSEDKSYYATKSFFDVFTVPLIEGSKDSLKEPNVVAISQHIANKYFGNESPIGKTILVNGRHQFAVSAVFEDMPKNSIIQSEFLFSYESFYARNPWARTTWGGDRGCTFIQFRPDANPSDFAEKAFPEMIAQNYAERLESRGMRDEFFIQPIRDIHLNSNLEAETEPPGNGTVIDILSGFSLFILIVAWINYVNLTTAKSMDRAREIGIKKIVGASKKSLVIQFFSEALLFNLLCLGITLVLFELIDPYFSRITGIEDFNLFAYNGFLGFAFGIFILGVFISSIYPAFILQSYKPITVLRGKFKNSAQGIILRKGLVAIQFMISVVLLIGTVISYLQTKHLMDKSMGINYQQSVVISLPKTNDNRETLTRKLDLIGDRLDQMPEIDGFTFASDIPGQEIETFIGGRRKGYDNGDQKAYFQIAGDNNFLDYYQLELLAGRKFRPNETAKNNKVILNIKAMQRLGYEIPEETINQIITSGKNELEIIGIVKDFHYKSIKVEAVPTILTLNNQRTFLTVRFNRHNRSEPVVVLSKIENIFKEHFPGTPFDYFFLDDWMKQDLKSEKTFSIVFSLFSTLAIVISIIGVVGLILITIKQRLKEIAIRKALGSGLFDISTLLVKQLANQILLASFIIAPVSWYGYKHFFINNYLYRIELNLWMFICPILILTTILICVVQIIALWGFKVKIAPVLQYE